VALLLISVALVTVSSYAWLSMNMDVTARGIELSMTSPSNMVIKGPADTDFSAIGTANPYAQNMYPSSSYDGVTFFALEDGEYVGEEGVADEDNTVFRNVSGKPVSDLEEGYYADYEFIIKNMAGTPDEKVKVDISTLTVTSPEEDSTLDRTIRVAVFEKNGENNLILRIFKPADTREVDSIKEIDGAGHISSTAKGFADCDGYFEIEGSGGQIVLLVRVWIEGQHPECKGDNRQNSAAIDIEFGIVESP